MSDEILAVETDNLLVTFDTSEVLLEVPTELILHEASGEIEVLELPGSVEVLELPPEIVLLEIAQQGPPGAPGENGIGPLPPINFSYGDVSTRTIYTLPDDVVVSSIELVIETPFDGEPSTLQVRTNSSVLMDTFENSATIAACYETAPQVRLMAGTTIELITTLGSGCATGSGFILLTLN